MSTVKFLETYPQEPSASWTMTVDGGPMSISHWGMHDLGHFGAMILDGKEHWLEDGDIFEVREWLE